MSPMGSSRKSSGRLSPRKWLSTGISAAAGAIVGTQAVMHPHHGLLTNTIGPWLVEHGLTSAQALGAYDAAMRNNIDRLMPGLAVYVLFGLYWAIASRNRAADATTDPSSYNFHKFLVGLSLLLICLPLPGLAIRLLPPSALPLTLGIILELGGVALAVASRRALGRNWSREVRIGVGHELVQSGPYALIRHPIYTGALCISLGLAVQSGLLSAFVGLAVLILAYVRKIALEERLLGEAFGSSFDQYRANSWALIPFLI
jgi:protein-S-isoprenylcysteine O-methyltransferase Ste14